MGFLNRLTVDGDQSNVKNYSAGTGITISENGVISATGVGAIDENLSTVSTNPVQNKAVTNAVNGKQDKLTAGTGITIQGNVISSTGGVNIDTALSTTSVNPVQNKVITNALNGLEQNVTNLTNEVNNLEGSVTNISNQVTNITQEITDLGDDKQDKLVAGENITIVGNVISATGGGGSVVVDSVLSTTSTNPVQNKVITQTLNGMQASIGTKQERLTAGANITIDANNVISASGGGGLPSGGTTGQALVKRTDSSYDVEWATVGGGGVTVDDALSTTSENPVQNKVITSNLNSLSSSVTNIDNRVTNIETGGNVDDALSTTSTNAVQNKVITGALDGKQDTLVAGTGITITGNVISASGGGGGSLVEHELWLLDLKTYGNRSYVYQDKAKYYELLRDFDLCIHDDYTRTLAAEIADEHDKVGLYLSLVPGFSNLTAANQTAYRAFTKWSQVANASVMNALESAGMFAEVLGVSEFWYALANTNILYNQIGNWFQSASNLERVAKSAGALNGITRGLVAFNKRITSQVYAITNLANGCLQQSSASAPYYSTYADEAINADDTYFNTVAKSATAAARNVKYSNNKDATTLTEDTTLDTETKLNTAINNRSPITPVDQLIIATKMKSSSSSASSDYLRVAPLASGGNNAYLQIAGNIYQDTNVYGALFGGMAAYSTTYTSPNYVIPASSTLTVTYNAYSARNVKEEILNG